MSGSAEKPTPSSGSTQKALPIALDRFLKELEGTRDEVFSVVLKTRHAREKKTRAEWREVLGTLGTKKVSY